MTSSAVPTKSVCTAPFAEFCVPFLLSARNPDGGWGYTPGGPSAVEPTCWALLALRSIFPFPVSHFPSQDPDSSLPKEPAQALRKPETGNSILPGGLEWLREAQLADGSWPAFKGQPEGCWVTALACQVLGGTFQFPVSSSQTGVAPNWKLQTGNRDLASSRDRGVRWLCDTWPAEGKYWRRLLQRWGRKISRQDSSLQGWSWTPGTASWVEPTSHALMLLKSLPEHALPRSASQRVRLAEPCSMTACVPAAAGMRAIPRFTTWLEFPTGSAPTVWALLALAHHPERTENQQSLEWLAGAYQNISGPGSLALAHLFLSAYGPTPPLGAANTESVERK